MAQFEIKDLSFAYPGHPDRKVLDGLSLNIEAGEYVTLCGRSGSGKTTLLRHLKSVLAPHGTKEGEILFDGRPLDAVTPREQASRIGYVMQNPDSQIVTDKVWHELSFGLESLGEDQATIRTRVAEMASYFGIQGWFHRNVNELSGGQKQLLNLASVMAMQPDILILDEPTSQLDPIAATDFLNTIRKINLELGTTILITEHRLEDIFHASDTVVVLEDGKLLCKDSPKKIGAFLKESGNEMFAALPSPVQIYYGVEHTPAGETALSGSTHAEDCPLTVREGRSWLSGAFEGHRPQEAVIEEPPYDDEVKDPVLRLKEVWYRYEKDAADILKGAEFAVERGEIFAVVGGNGTGKSTMLKAICNICPPYRGHVYLDGKKISSLKSRELFKGKLAMLPQDPQSLFVKKTVREELEEMCSDKNDPRIEDVAALCEVDQLFASHPYDLSGGEQQRAALAKVLLTDPELLLLDEPTKGMDSFFKQKFARILRDLKARGVTILMVSHDVEFCARHADRVGMFFDGALMSTNTPRRFFSQNSFYTTAANRMSRHLFPNAITNEDVTALYGRNADAAQVNTAGAQKEE
ncbi:MAG: ATP-binding cassette domain-containing protein [Clostridiales bacterium]|nr:ATP-binding cassette domain-containing protein [Clostridiales bacterium]